MLFNYVNKEHPRTNEPVRHHEEKEDIASKWDWDLVIFVPDLNLLKYAQTWHYWHKSDWAKHAHNEDLVNLYVWPPQSETQRENNIQRQHAKYIDNETIL